MPPTNKKLRLKYKFSASDKLEKHSRYLDP